MSTDFRLPNITAQTLPGQVQQIQSYLFQLVQQLEFEFNRADTNSQTPATQTQTSGGIADPNEMQAQAIFNSIKQLIIRSTDIIDAYYQKMSEKMKGDYVSSSDYQAFSSTTTASLKDLSEAIDPLTDHIRAGILYRDTYGESVYGLEIGRWIGTGEDKTFEKYARFTDERTSFYGADGSEVVWITDGKVYFMDSGWVDLGLSASVSESAVGAGRAEDTGCHYRVSPGDNHIYVAFNCAFSGSPVQVNAVAIPAAYCPLRDVRTICAVSGGLACVLVNSSGNVLVDWIQSAEGEEPAVEWIDGYIDYWI